MSYISPGEVPGVAGLGICFIPSPPLPSPQQNRQNIDFSNQSKQTRRDVVPDYHSNSSSSPRRSVRHSISHESAMSRNYQLGGRRGAICEGMYQPNSEIARSLNNFNIVKGGKDSREDYHHHHQGHSSSQLSPFSEESVGSPSSSESHSYSPPHHSEISPSSINLNTNTTSNMNRNIYRQAVFPPPPPRPQNREIRHSQSMGILPSQKITTLPPPATVFRGLGFSTNNQPYPLSPTHLTQSPPTSSSLSPISNVYSMLPLTPPCMPAAVEVPVVNRSPSRLPAFLIERHRREALARPKSMMELGQQYALDAIADEEEEEIEEVQSVFEIENEDEYFTSGNGVEVELREEEEEEEGNDQYDDAISDFHSSIKKILPQTISSSNQDEPLLRHKPSLHRLFSNRSRSLSTGDAPPSPAELAQLRLYASMHNLRARLEQPYAGARKEKNYIEILEEQVEEIVSEQESPAILAPRAFDGTFVHSSTSLSQEPRLPSTLVDSRNSESRPTITSVQHAQIQLEEEKVEKARVKLDLMLDSTTIVEGGYVKGSIEVRMGKRTEKEGGNVWIGTPKIRIVGFEELTSQSGRNIFYHHATTLSAFVDSEKTSLLSCFEATGEADVEGYRSGIPGQHKVPFDILLPVGKGAKGSCKVKQGVIRYIAIASIQLKSQYGDDRSIAHLYKQIDISPYFDPSTTLASALQPIISTSSKALFMGGTGKVALSASIRRSTWIAGQKLYVDVKIENQSSKKMNSLSIALIRSTAVMQPQLGSNTPGTPEIDRLTIRKKVAESTLEIGKRGVTVRGSEGTWSGVDAGLNAEVSHFLELPAGTLTISKGQYFEISYVIRVSVIAALSSEVTTDLPVTIINFISLDPPGRHTGLSSTLSIPIALTCEQVTTATFTPSHAMSRDSSIDSISLSDLNSNHPVTLGLTLAFGLGARKQLNHQMSLDCISSAIASATARNKKTGSRLTNDSANSSLVCSPTEESIQHYGIGASGTFTRTNEDHSLLDDLDEIPDDDDSQYYESPQKMEAVESRSLINFDSDEELEAVMGSSTFGGSESSPLIFLSNSSIRAATSPQARKSPSVSLNSSSSIVRSRPPSPLKNSILPPPLPPKSTAKRAGTFAFATPSSPVKSTLPLPSPFRNGRNISPTRNISLTRLASGTKSVPVSPLTRVPSRALPPRPLFAGHAVRRPEGRSSSQETPPVNNNSNRIVKKDSSLSLKRATAVIAKKPSSRVLRDGRYIHSPSSASSSPPDLDSASDKSTPDMYDHVRTPNLVSPFLNQRPPFNSNPRKVVTSSPSLYSSRSVGDLRAPAPPPHRRSVILPSVLNKVAAMDSRQAALMRLARLAVDGPEFEGTLVRTHSIATSEASFKLSDLERANSVDSFKAPMLRK